MINVINGDILTASSGVLIHGCNPNGVMGHGLAKQIKEKWPDNFKAYQEFCGTMSCRLGSYCLHYDGNMTIVNMITQSNIGTNKRQVNYAYLAKGFIDLFDCLYDGSIVHFPMIGAGLGGGNWSIIYQIINDTDPHDRLVKNLWVMNSPTFEGMF